MFAVHITEPAHRGWPEVRHLVIVSKKSERDKLIRHVNADQAAWAEFRRKHPYDTVPSSYHWIPGTKAEPMPMRDARKLIAGRLPDFESDGWCRAYGYVPCAEYEYKVYFKDDPATYGRAA